MEFKLGFFGATRNVTGSRYLLQANDKNILVDCGLYQEREFKHRNWERFPIHPSKIDIVVLTHAHLDHCGLLPKLVNEGFQGKVHCTSATAEIAKIVMLDCAHINEEDAEFKRRRHQREGRQGKYPVRPLYTQEDAMAVFPLLAPWDLTRPLDLGAGIELEFIAVAHILGAASVRFTITQENEKRSIVFSGDIGRWDMPILKDPVPVGPADYLVMESTYGDRLHGPQEDIPKQLAEIINQADQDGGNIVIPSFAIERTQELMYFLSTLLKENRIPHLQMFVDSPMAVKVTNVFKRYPHLFDREAQVLMRSYWANSINLVRSVSQSKSINHIRGSAIIIAGSGMCTGGRIKHHLTHNIERPESVILFIGYQAQGTLGRIILEGNKRVRILGKEYDVKARIARISGFSAHADRDELLRWLDSVSTKPRKVFITHGESEASLAFAEHLGKIRDWDICVPEFEDSYTLN